MNKVFWRFYLFTEADKYYCFDCFSCKTYLLEKELYNYLTYKNKTKIKKDYPEFFKIFQKKEIIPSPIYPLSEEICINYSNNCNLNCVYCYRNKDDITTLSNKEIENIMKYIFTIYCPTAKRVDLNVGFSSETSLEVDKLILFDKLIVNYEGYLYTSDDFTTTSELNNFEKKITTLINKTLDISKPTVELLNILLMEEQFWKYISIQKLPNFSNSPELKNMFESISYLSLSKKVKLNRLLLDYYFHSHKGKNYKDIRIYFMTNGTNVNENYLKFIKSRLIKDLYISLDGSKEINDLYRLDKNKNSSYEKVKTGIKKLQDNNINLTASFVILPNNTNLYELIGFFISQNFHSVSFNFIRGTQNLSYSETDIEILINSCKKIYDKFLIELKTNDYKYLKILKNTIFISYLKFLIRKEFVITRCNFGNKLTIDNHGNLYHCFSTVGNKDDYLGNFKDGISQKKIKQNMSVNNYSSCKKCCMKYLCGGTCYGDIYEHNINAQKVECTFRKELAKLAIHFYIKLSEENMLKKITSYIFWE